MRRSAAASTWVLPILVLAQLGLTAALTAQEVGREVFRRPELEAAGVHRLSEAMQWIGWNLTPDAFGWSVSLQGLPAGALPRSDLPDWTLLVDGHRVEPGLRGIVIPDLAPALIQQVDSIEVRRVPGITAGVFTGAGQVSIHTRRAPRGLFAHAWGRHGSETGDPGPDLFTGPLAPNVERTGADRVLTAGYGGRGWEVQLSTRNLMQEMLDPRFERYGAGNALYPRYAEIGGAVGRIAADALQGRHELLLASTKYRGFLYVPASERLENSGITLQQVAATGSVGLGRFRKILYRGGIATLGLDRRMDQAAPEGSHERTTRHGSVELRQIDGAFLGTVGATVEQRALQPASGAGPADRVQTTVYAEADRRVGQWRHRHTGALVQAGDRLGVKASSAVEVRLDRGRTVGVAASLVEQLPEEGAAWMNAWSLNPAAPPVVPRRTLWWSELEWMQPMQGRLTLQAGVVYGALSESRAVDRSVPDASSPPGGKAPLRLSGGRVGMKLGLSAEPSPRLGGRVTYQSIAPTGGSEDLRQAMQSLSAHVVQAGFHHVPVPGLRWAVRADLRSRTGWRGSQLVLGQDETLLPPITRIDLSIEKWWWRQRVRTQLALRNLLNEPELYHPLGAEYALRYFIGASLELPARD